MHVRLPSHLALCALVSLAAAPGRADAGWRLPFEVVGPDQGLPSGQAITMAQASDGFLWIGTENGIVRYEGGQVRRFTREDGLPSSYVHRLVATGDGAVWAATARGVVRLRNGRIERAHLEGEAEDVQAGLLEVDANGRPWVTTRTAVFALSSELSFRRQAWDGAPVTALAAGADGTLYAAGPGVLRAYRPDGSVRDLGQDAGLPPDGARLLVEDGSGRLWAGAGPSLMVKLPGAARFEDRSRLLPAALAANGVVLRDRDGSVWFPTQRGALHLFGDASAVLGPGDGLPFGWVRTVFRDRERTLWVVGPSLARLQGEGRLRALVPPFAAQGSVVWAVQRGPDGRLLVGSDDGAAWLDGGEEQPIPGTEGRRIKALAVDREGRAWLVSSTGPALWLERGARRAVTAPLGEHGAQLNAVLVDRGGTVWVCHALEGILRWDPTARALVHDGPPALQAKGKTVAASGVGQDVAGRLWFATSAGLVVRGAEGGWRTFGTGDGLPLTRVRGVVALPDTSAWLFFEEPAGLLHVRLLPGGLEVLEHRRQGEGLATDQVYAAAADAAGRLWYSTEQGFDRLAPPLHVGRQDGMLNEDCSLHGVLVEGEVVWVGTSGGLVRYDAAGTDAPLVPPRAEVLDATLGRTSHAPPFGALAPVPPEEPTARFRIGAPAFAHERALRFQVRLTGLEEAWRDVEAPLVRYTGLSAGPHRFEVRATYDGKAFGPAGGLDFTVLPPWWQTWWARAALAAGLLLLARALLHLRLAALRRSKAELEALVAHRTAELRERNEQLEGALSEVRELSGLLPICMHCKRIRNDGGYWEKIEKYVAERTRASFTHGLCPECLPRYLPPE